MVAATLSRDTRVVASDAQVSADLAQETVILSMRDGQYYGLDGVGHVVWQRLRAPVSLAELTAAIVAEFEVDPMTAERDLRVLLEDLLTRGLAERVADPAGPSVAVLTD